LDGIITTIMATIQRINIIGSREGSRNRRRLKANQTGKKFRVGIKSNRSEERRVGKECRCRWSADLLKNNHRSTLTDLTCPFHTPFFFFKQKTAYEIGLGIPAEPLFRSPSNSRFPRLCAKCLLKLKRLVSILPMTKSKK